METEFPKNPDKHNNYTKCLSPSGGPILSHLWSCWAFFRETFLSCFFETLCWRVWWHVEPKWYSKWSHNGTQNGTRSGCEGKVENVIVCSYLFFIEGYNVLETLCFQILSPLCVRCQFQEAPRGYCCRFQ